jgi:hypothetical protein
LGSDPVELRMEAGVNKHRLEELLHLERLQLLHVHNAWLDQRERNLQLREYILSLQEQLEHAGIDYAPLPMPTDHPMFAFMQEGS